MSSDRVTEAALLGAALRAPRDIFRVDAVPVADDFWDAPTAEAWRVACALVADGKPLGLDTLLGALAGRQDAVDAARAAWMASSVPDRGAVELLCSQVLEASRRRRLRAALLEEVARLDKGEAAASVVSSVEAKGLEIVSGTDAASPESVADIAETVWKLDDDPAKASRIRTGIRQLDWMCGHGWGRGEVHVIAGRPGMGKSAFAGHLVKGMARQGHPALVASIEMKRESWVRRYLSDDRERDRKALAGLPLWIFDPGTITAPALRSMARRFVVTRGVQVVVVDYLQLVKSGLKTRSREEEVAEVSRSLVAMAKDLDVLVIALAQLNRGSEKAADKRPHMADLRESGQIEQDAHTITMLYRDEYYYPAKDATRDVVELHMRKNRSGAATDPNEPILARFDKKAMRFVTMEQDEWKAYAMAVGG